MRLLVGLVILVIAGCALMAAHARKPFPLMIDAQSPGVWPRYASFYAPTVLMCRPMVIKNGPQRRPIVRT